MDEAVVGTVEIEGDTPARLDTYALAYGSGIVWLFLAIVLLGAQRQFAFDGVYDSLLAFPPVATALTVLLADRHGSWRSFPWRVLLFATVCTVASAASTVILAPFLILSFRGGVTGNLDLTGVIASVALAIVASPLVFGLVRAVKHQAYGRAFVLVMGLGAAAIALAMALDPTGALATSMRLDQARIMMVVAAWWLPVYAATGAVLRRSGLA